MNNCDWEARCHRCGRCCYEKIEYEGRVYYTDKPCDKLDLKSLHCTVYNDRHIEKPQCMALTQESIEGGILPADCPYVSGISGYKAPQLWDEPSK